MERVRSKRHDHQWEKRFRPTIRVPKTLLRSDPRDREFSVTVRALRFDGKNKDPKNLGAQRRGYDAMPLHEWLQKIADQDKVVDEKVSQLA